MARAAPASVDLVCLAPPFNSTLLVPALSAAARIVRAGGFVYVEGREPVGADAAALLGFESWRAGRAGAVHFQLLKGAAPG